MIQQLRDWAKRHRKLVAVLGGIGVIAILTKSSRANAPGNLFARYKAPSSPSPSGEDKFTASLPSNAKRFAGIILRVADEEGISPYLIYAIGEQESRWGGALSYDGKGDGGHGHGIMQIDDRSFGSWLASNNWKDPYTNVKKGVQILKGKRRYLENKVPSDKLEEASIAAYNTGEGNVAKSIAAGRHPDSTTAGGAYSANIYRRIAALA